MLSLNRKLYVFCGKVVLLILILTIIDTLVGVVIESKIGSGQLDTVSDIEYVQREKPEILVIGSSSAQLGYNSKLINKLTGMKTINIGTGGATSAYVYIVLKQLIKNYKPRYIVYDNHEEDILGAFKSDKTISSLSYLYGNDREIDRVINEEVPFSRVIYLSKLIKYRTIIKNLFQFSRTLPGDNYSYIEPDNGAELEFDIAKRKQANNTFDSAILKPDSGSLSYRCFKDLIQLCESNKIKMLVVRSPRYPWSESIDRTNAIELVKRNLNTPTTKFKHISLEKYPYFKDKKFYKDAVHVNALGADSISTIVSEIIKKRVFEGSEF